MRGTVLGILGQTGPILIRTSQDADKPSSQVMALLGSLAAFADTAELKLNHICTSSSRLSFTRFVPYAPVVEVRLTHDSDNNTIAEAAMACCTFCWSVQCLQAVVVLRHCLRLATHDCKART